MTNSLLSLRNHLDFVALGLGRESHGGVQLTLLTLHLLHLDLDLLLSFDDINLDLLVSDLLTDLGGLQLVRQLRLGFL